MPVEHSREEILKVLGDIDAVAVATSAGATIRTRMMHFAFDENFRIYLATMKGDPKILHLTSHPSVNLLFRFKGDHWTGDKEIEIVGVARIARSASERKVNFDRERDRSPIVGNLVATGNTHVLESIVVEPKMVKYRVVGEVVQGVPPTVIEFKVKEGMESTPVKLKVKNWITAVRAPFLVAPVTSVLLGTAVAFALAGVFRPLDFVLTLAGILLIHSGANIANDYFDHRSGNDEINREFVRPFSGGSRVIQLGLLTPTEILAGAIVLFSLGSMIGVYLAVTRGWIILAIGLVGVLTAFFYTAPPVYLAKRGIGEVIVGLDFGTLVTVGAFYVQTGYLAWEAAFASLPVALLIAAVLYINEFPDYAADRDVGKRTLVVRLGRKKAALSYAIVMSFTVVYIIGASLSGLISTLAILGVLSFPLTFKALRFSRKYYEDSLELVPANASTIMCFMVTGLLMSVGYVLDAVQMGGLLPISAIVLVMLVLLYFLNRHVERQIEAFHGVKKLAS